MTPETPQEQAAHTTSVTDVIDVETHSVFGLCEDMLQTFAAADKLSIYVPDFSATIVNCNAIVGVMIGLCAKYDIPFDYVFDRAKATSKEIPGTLTGGGDICQVRSHNVKQAGKNLVEHAISLLGHYRRWTAKHSGQLPTNSDLAGCVAPVASTDEVYEWKRALTVHLIDILATVCYVFSTVGYDLKDNVQNTPNLSQGEVADPKGTGDAAERRTHG